jgi:hypothetical protein
MGDQQVTVACDCKSSSGNKGATPSVTSSMASSITAITTQQSTPIVGWAGVHCAFAHYTNLQDLILLDIDSTDTIFCNPNYVTNITDTEEKLEVMTNGGPLMSMQRCEIPHLGECWYNKHSITNIIALSDMTDTFRVTMDSTKEKALLVHFWNKVGKRAYKARELYHAMGTPIPSKI